MCSHHNVQFCLGPSFAYGPQGWQKVYRVSKKSEIEHKQLASVFRLMIKGFEVTHDENLSRPNPSLKD